MVDFLSVAKEAKPFLRPLRGQGVALTLVLWTFGWGGNQSDSWLLVIIGGHISKGGSLTLMSADPWVQENHPQI